MVLDEKGIWVVYDLKANSAIQRMLLKQGWRFEFYPNIIILDNKLKKDRAEATLRRLRENRS